MQSLFVVGHLLSCLEFLVNLEALIIPENYVHQFIIDVDTASRLFKFFPFVNNSLKNKVTESFEAHMTSQSKSLNTFLCYATQL